MSEIILASASPRRRELLANMGLSFTVTVSDADESAVEATVPPEIYVQELALLKAAAVAKTVIKNKNALVISADTIVVDDGVILGKPEDEADAIRMLTALSGKAHKVYTGFCVMRISDALTVCKNVCTEVVFKSLTQEKIERYVKTSEPIDKAGAYGIQGLGAMLVDRINGDYFNVVGLPVSELSDVLETEFGFKLM
ncbi:MAG: septum formation inhibitor Maf [Clostridia bacterium]|nr:septum formation inhibitor Maf [Clostridia bacterium]